MTVGITPREPVTETLLIRSGLSMDVLLEQFDDVVGHFVDPVSGALGECLALLFAFFEDLLAFCIDLFASLLQAALFELLRLLFRFCANFLGTFPGLGYSLVAVVFCQCDDLVGLVFGRLNSFENLWPRHTLSNQTFARACIW